jgi:hypothetical protein
MSQKRIYVGVFFLSTAISLGGIPFAAYICKCDADAGRGGALGSALAFLFLFITNDYGTKLFQAVTKELPGLKARVARLKTQVAAPAEVTLPDVEAKVARLEQKISKIETEVGTLVNRIDIDGQGQRAQSIWLAVATVIGTIAWGFGDLAAKHLLPHH